MPILIDTNVLLRSVQTFHPMHVVAVRALEVLMQREEPLVITIQNIAEFWNVATRPAANNGLGFTIEEAQEELIKLEGFFQILSENASSYAAWKTLLIANRVSGIQVHDARLVAVMKAYGIAQIVTFTRFLEIEAIHPDKFTEQ